MPRTGPLLSREISRTAKAAIDALTRNGLNCCLFGSSACWYYGMNYRVPNDVDVVVMEDPAIYNTESLKLKIVDTDPNFYLVDARDPRATYRVLWYRLGPRIGRSSNTTPRSCKVDILLSGPEPLSIPYIPHEHIPVTASSGMPLMPFVTLILLKLKGWSDHRADHRHWMRDKVSQDEDDLDELLNIATIQRSARADDENHLWEDWFVDQGLERIQEYCEEWPGTWHFWSKIFNLAESEDTL